MIVQPGFDIIENAQLRKQTDILKSTRHAQLIDFDLFFTGDIFAVQNNFAGGRLVNTGQHIKNGGFTGAVRANQPVKLAFFNFQVKLVNRAKSAELNS